MKIAEISFGFVLFLLKIHCRSTYRLKKQESTNNIVDFKYILCITFMFVFKYHLKVGVAMQPLEVNLNGLIEIYLLWA